MKDKIAFPGKHQSHPADMEHLRGLEAAAVPIGVPKLPVFAARDLVEQSPLREGDGPTYFFSREGSKWFSLGRDANFLGVCVLKEVREDVWGPLVGARVVLRLQEGQREAFDLNTAASGETFAIPPTALMVRAGETWRVEVQAPGANGAVARVALHVVMVE